FLTVHSCAHRRIPSAPSDGAGPSTRRAQSGGTHENDTDPAGRTDHPRGWWGGWAAATTPSAPGPAARTQPGPADAAPAGDASADGAARHPDAGNQPVDGPASHPGAVPGPGSRYGAHPRAPAGHGQTAGPASPEPGPAARP